jgi:hypothetical protein
MRASRVLGAQLLGLLLDGSVGVHLSSEAEDE